jgi:hypothetical protein
VSKSNYNKGRTETIMLIVSINLKKDLTNAHYRAAYIKTLLNDNNKTCQQQIDSNPSVASGGRDPINPQP